MTIRNDVDKVKNKFGISISKERLRCLIAALNWECLSEEPSVTDRDSFVVLEFSKDRDMHLVTFFDVGERDSVILSRD